MKPSPLVIITGPSGAGKATLLRALEDRGFFCVDNLPAEFVTKFAELIAKGDVERGALVVDVRERQALDLLPGIYQELISMPDLDTSLCFVEASDDVIIRRFSETRRPHPMDAKLPIREAIMLERQRLAPIRRVAKSVVDTSQFSIHDLRAYADRLIQNSDSPRLLVTLISFGFKYGIPIDADMILDVRFLPNPHFIQELRPLTGSDRPIVEFMDAQPATKGFLTRLESMLGFLLPEYEREGKSYLTIAIGCTGGRHRSVMIVNALEEYFRQGEERRVKVIHRDVEK